LQTGGTVYAIPIFGGMMDVQAIIEGMATLITEAIPSLHVYPMRPGAIDTPACIFTLDKGDFDAAMGGQSDDLMFLATIFTSIADAASGEKALYSYLSRSGPNSIKEAFENGDDTLGGLVSYVLATGWRAPGLATFGNVQYFALPIELTIGVDN
jgi:hypothetical protein